MPKKGQHQGDANDKTKSKGHNNPSKSQTITTGSPKKQETIKRQAAEHKDPHKQPQAAKNDWGGDTRARTNEKRAAAGAERSGSDSNAGPGSRGY